MKAPNDCNANRVRIGRFSETSVRMLRIGRIVKFALYAAQSGSAALRLLLVAGIAHLLRRAPSFRGYWLIAERHDEARDNGYHFFKFLRENHPEIEAIFVIDPKSPDSARVAAIGRTVSPGGWKHYLYYALCDVAISTHVYAASPEARAAKFLRHLLPKKKIVLLGHGIRKDHYRIFERSRSKVDLLCCGAYPEYAYLNDNCGYAEHELVYTGFARYDALLDQEQSRRQILIMPTFRRWLHDLSLLPPAVRSAAFRQESFYLHYQALLASSRFIEILNTFDLRAVFYPHYRVHPFLDQFHTASDRIILGDRDSHDIQMLLKQSVLLITDYSSVFFDFSYMDKPIIFFQFDAESYRERHYKEGYFSYERDGFGPVVDNIEGLLAAVQAACASRFSVPEKYRVRAARFFTFRDRRNCERTYGAITKLLTNTATAPKRRVVAGGSASDATSSLGRNAS